MPTPPDPKTLPPNVAYTHRRIAVPPQAVYDALTDFDRYPHWNSFTVGASAEALAVGAPLTLTVQMSPNSRTTTAPEIITLVDPPNALGWRYNGPAWLLRATRYQMMQPTDDGGTDYITWETFEGPMALVLRWTGMLAAVQRGFDRSADELKRYVKQ
ncbi:MAG: SRPBCC domain-containing protein [Chloroflexota bacterium]